MTVFMIDSIRFNDLEEALVKLTQISGPDCDLGADVLAYDCVAVMRALGGGDPRKAPAMIRYLLEQEKKRISTPR